MCISLKMFSQENSQLPRSQAHIVFFKEKKTPDNRKTHFKRKCVYDVLWHFLKYQIVS